MNVFKKTKYGVFLFAVSFSITSIAQEFILQTMNFSDVQKIYLKTPDNDGADWFCAYNFVKNSKKEKLPSLIAFDQNYLFIKVNNQYKRLNLVKRNIKNNEEKNVSYKDDSFVVKIDDIKDSNYSEYKESFDRKANVYITNDNETKKYLALGSRCGM